MAKKQYTLSIQNPCSENWDAMTPEVQGRFCAHCQKTVIDFTTLSNKEIVKIIEQNKDNLCGRLRADQQNVPIIVEPKTFRIHFPKIAAATLLFLGLARDAEAQKATTPSIQSSNNTLDSTILKEGVNDMSSIVIKDRIYDISMQAMPEAIINGYDNNFNFIGQAISDKYGYYEISLKNFKVGRIFNISLENQDTILKKFTIGVTESVTTYNLFLGEAQAEFVPITIPNNPVGMIIRSPYDNTSQHNFNWIFWRRFLRENER